MKKIIKLLCLALCINSTSYANSLSDHIAKFNPGESERISRAIYTSAYKYHIDPLFLASIYQLESGYHNEAVSSAGALGIAQLMPDTAKYLKANPYNIESNIDGGAKYLAEMLELHKDKGIYKNNYALASYNAGPANVERGIPSYTFDYIESIHSIYKQIKSEVKEERQIKSNHTNHTKILLLSKLKQLRNKKKGA